MLGLNFDLIKEHPYISGGVILVGGTVVYLWYRNRQASVSDVSQTVSTDNPTADQLSILEQQQAGQQNLAVIQANAQTQQIQGQIQLAQLQYGVTGQVDLAQIDAQLKATEDTNAAGIAAAQITAQTQGQSISAQEAVILAQYENAATIQANNNATSVSMAQINAGTVSDIINAVVGLNTPTTTTTAAPVIVTPNPLQGRINPSQPRSAM